jgi:hypothetical protein
MKRNCYPRERYFAWNGGVLLVVGIVLLLDRLGIVPVSVILRFWPVVLVAAGTVLLIEVSSLVGRTIGAVLVGGGLLVLASNLGYIRVRGEVFWPLALIAIGVILLGRALEERNRPPALPGAGLPEGQPDFSDRFWSGAERFRAGAERFARNLESHGNSAGGGSADGEYTCVFSHAERHITDQNFEKLKVAAVFGGFELDLRGASIRGDEAWIQADAVFGGIEIVVPDDWQVIPRGAGVFGGFSDETHLPEIPTKKLIVSGAGVFGGVVITNDAGRWSRHRMKRRSHWEHHWRNRD